MKEVNYKELFNRAEAIVEEIYAPFSLSKGTDLLIHIKNLEDNSPIKKIRFPHLIPLRYKDHIRYYYLNSKEVVTERGFMGATIKSYYIPKMPLEEENVELIEIFSELRVQASYGSIEDRLVKVKK